jgi:hypothetical protein
VEWEGVVHLVELLEKLLISLASVKEDPGTVEAQQVGQALVRMLHLVVLCVGRESVEVLCAIV